MELIIYKPSQVLTFENGALKVLSDVDIVIKDGKIAQVKKLSVLPKNIKIISAENCVVLPGFVDSHTHLVFKSLRSKEFFMRLDGISYEQILAQGGGILSTVKEVRETDENELYEIARERILSMLKWGTTTVEIKSGYGLSWKHELKMLRVINRLRKDLKDKITVIATFMGAHAIPPNRSLREYTKELIEVMIPQVSKKKLAQFVDVFCEKFVFPPKQAEKILTTAKKYGLIIKIHADEIENSGGTELAGRLGCISAEHLNYATLTGLRLLKKKQVVCVLLPGTTFFLKSRKKPPVQEMRKLGLPIALASDFNPGTCPIYQMPIIITLGCLLYGLSPQEALCAATINGAKALGLNHKIGLISEGYDADLIILNTSNYKELFFQLGTNLIRSVIKQGRVVLSN
ncbi:MAG: imidazolonepropionase [candidate division WOR-3 bacterium]|nr:imidazolonepropionase [candidate division WOR-3 bacterium]MCX7757805.1 imidazolonepropionase [candidate division WOR-3 bacterium]MDW7987202.1 imidazolonepropionase [candidate division WOR-3 bacterium]